MDVEMATPRKPLERIILFARYPEPGRSKTRLIPVLGPSGAADLHRRMTEHVLARLRQVEKSRLVSICVYYDGGTLRGMREWLGTRLRFRRQAAGDLGARMAAAFDDAFRAGLERVLIIGADCPDLSSAHLEAALDALVYGPIVLGPAEDGGYYLVGLNRPLPQLFAGVPWGTGQVLRRTRDKAAVLGIHPVVLEVLGDVDRPEDLSIWTRCAGT